LFIVGAGPNTHSRLDRSARLSRTGIRRTPGGYRPGVSLARGRFLLPNLHRRRAQMPSRSLPLFSRAARSCLRVALSTNASLLPRAAFGRVPPLHDERPPICVPMTITPVAFSPSETPVGRFPFRRTSLGVASARPVYNPPVVTESDAAPPPSVAPGRPLAPGTHPRPPPPWPLRTTGRRMRWRVWGPRNRSRSRH
jgi:hypothetical protein